ncbi:hypothetical protein KI387_022035, partial [Taxus chinensis]
MASSMLTLPSLSPSLNSHKYAIHVLGSNFGRSTSPGFCGKTNPRLSVSCFLNDGKKYRHPILVASASNGEEGNKQLGVDSRENPSYKQWDAVTSTIAGCSTIPFLLLQLPQILLNAQNLLSGNRAALLAVGWLGQLTGVLGNLSLLSYFAKKRETGAVIVQAVGVISIYAVIFQLAMGGAMPYTPFIATSVAVGSGLILNFLNYYNLLNAGIWKFWEDVITVGGLSVLPQVMWSTFVPYLPQSMLPGILSFVVALITVILARSGKLPKKAVEFVGSISGWTATLLFMWMPVAQMWTNYLNPENIRGLSVYSLLLAMIGNGLLVPRALFTRDVMWFTGSSWAAFLYGWGNILSIYICGGISGMYFWAITSAFLLSM